MNKPVVRRRPPLLLKLLLGLLGVALLILVLRHDAGATFGMPNDDFGRLAVLVAVLVFVGAGVISRVMRPGEIFRAMAAWLAIIIVLIGIYANRSELAGIAGRFVGALVPGVPVAGNLAGEANPDSVVIMRSGDGHFAVHATIDQLPTTLLLDTGASFVTLTYFDAMRIGINADALAYDVRIRTANGEMAAAAVTLDSLTIGPIERRNIRALVAPREALDRSLLGMSFLNTLAGYAITGDRLVLRP